MAISAVRWLYPVLTSLSYEKKKACDTTWEYGIFQDLHDVGLQWNLPIIIDNILCNQLFQVHLGAIRSDKTVHSEGAPQWAILSTTLCNVKIKDIVKQVNWCSVFSLCRWLCYYVHRGYAKDNFL